MTEQNEEMNIKKVGIVYHPKVESTLIKAKELESSLTMQGVITWICSSWEKQAIQTKIDGTDLILTVGGDGTILRAVQAIIPNDIPVTGINQGKLGFLTEFDTAEAIQKLPILLSGQGWFDQRVMLQAELSSQGEETRVFHALNDVVVARGEIARIIRIEAIIDGQPFTKYRTDALIVATATGSTGYAIAARGPILHPQSRDILLVPVAAHLSLSYPLVLPENSEIELHLNTYHAATLSVDGQMNLPVSDGATVKIKLSPYTARFFRIRSEKSFYHSLEDKLKGKQIE